MKKTGLKRYVYDFSVNYASIDVDDIVGTHKYLMKKDDIKCLDLLTKTFIGLLRVCTIENFGKSLTFNSKGSIKCVSLNNQPRKARPTWKPWWKIFFIHLLLVLLSVTEVVILLIIHMLAFVFQMKFKNEFKSV